MLWLSHFKIVMVSSKGRIILSDIREYEKMCRNLLEKCLMLGEFEIILLMQD